MKALAIVMFAVLPSIAVSSAFAQSADVLVNHYDFFEHNDGLGFWGKTLNEANTPEGKLIVGAVATWIGVDSDAVSMALELLNNSERRKDGPQHSDGIMRSPPGYTICTARVMNMNMGSGQDGVETHRGSSLTATIVRVVDGWNHDGLAWVMELPMKVSDTRVATSTIEVVYVKADQGWQGKYQCQPNGWHLFVSQNNVTKSNFACDPAEGAWCKD